MQHLIIWGATPTPASMTFDGFKELYGISMLELVSVEINGHQVDVWIDEEGRLGTQWADPDDPNKLMAIGLATDHGTVTLVGPVLLTGYDFGPLPPDLPVSWRTGYTSPL